MTKLIGTIRDCSNALSKDGRKCYTCAPKFCAMAHEEWRKLVANMD
jgi:hypothetical protein